MTALTSGSIKGAHHEQWVQVSTLPPGVLFQSITRFIVVADRSLPETCRKLTALLTERLNRLFRFGGLFNITSSRVHIEKQLGSTH